MTQVDTSTEAVERQIAWHEARLRMSLLDWEKVLHGTSRDMLRALAAERDALVGHLRKAEAERDEAVHRGDDWCDQAQSMRRNRDAVLAAVAAEREACAKVASTIYPPAHTFASENADIYRAQKRSQRARFRRRRHPRAGRTAMTDEAKALLERVAEILWRAESLRAAGMERRIAWQEESKDTRAMWRFMARAALAEVAAAAMQGSAQHLSDTVEWIEESTDYLNDTGLEGFPQPDPLVVVLRALAEFAPQEPQR